MGKKKIAVKKKKRKVKKAMAKKSAGKTSRIKKRRAPAKKKNRTGYIIFAASLLLLVFASAFLTLKILNPYGGLFKEAKSKEEIRRITLDEARYLFDSGKAVFIDARGSYQYADSHIEGALLSDDVLRTPSGSGIAEKLKNKVLVPYCHGVGCRVSDKAAARLFDMGYKNVVIFFGGWDQWTKAGYPVYKYKPPEKYMGLFDEAPSAQKIREITFEEAKFLYENNKANFIDADYTRAFSAIHIQRSASMPLDKVEELLKPYSNFLKSKPVVVYCHGKGLKARKAAEKLYGAGIKRVMVFIDAMPQWKENNMPLYKRPVLKQPKK